jgi:hypothetical protein
MSIVISRVCPDDAAARVAATTPDAGPDKIVSIGRSRAVLILNEPPFEAVM